MPWPSLWCFLQALSMTICACRRRDEEGQTILCNVVSQSDVIRYFAAHKDALGPLLDTPAHVMGTTCSRACALFPRPRRGVP